MLKIKNYVEWNGKYNLLDYQLSAEHTNYFNIDIKLN